MGVVCLKLDVQRQGGGKNFGYTWTGWWEVLKIRHFSWTSYVYHPLTIFTKHTNEVRQNSEYASGSEYTKVLNMPELHRVLSMPEYAKIIPEYV